MAKPQKVYYDKVTLCAGHALILGHCPDKMGISKLNQIIEEHPQDISKLGLFDSSSPNYTTYYPEVTAEDLSPKDDEFIEPVYRMLSNVTVHANFHPIYFPADVLKKSMYKLIGQTVNIDHEMAVGNAIGSVKMVEWQNAYTTKEGVKVPAGINATLKIDGKSNPRIARGIMMDPPSIHSNSVTVNFAWKKSHPEMSDEEFMSKLSTFDNKGNIIQKIVVEVVAYHETSLVGHGADPFAQKVGKDGKIVLPNYAKSRYPLSDQSIKDDLSFAIFDWKNFDGNSFGMETLSEDGTKIQYYSIDNSQTEENMDKFLRALEVSLGLEANSLTEENYQEKMTTLNTEVTGLRAKVAETPAPVKILDLEGLQAIETEITTLRAFKSEVPTDYKEKIQLAEVGTTILSELKDDTARLYKLTVESGKEDAAILAVINTASYETLKALHKQYDTLTDGQYSFTCQKCGSHEVTRASAKPTIEEPKAIASTGDVIDKFTSVGKVDTRFIEGSK